MISQNLLAIDLAGSIVSVLGDTADFFVLGRPVWDGAEGTAAELAIRRALGGVACEPIAARVHRRGEDYPVTFWPHPVSQHAVCVVLARVGDPKWLTLTERQRAVCGLLPDLPRRDICRRLDISESTFDTHLLRIRRAVRVDTAGGLVAWCIRHR